jgi:hypothetical protein
MEMPKDKLGRDITVGDYIVYVQRASSSIWLDIGKVISIGSKKSYSGKEEPFITIRGCRDFFNRPNLKIRNGKITRFDHCIVVSGAALPEKYFELLKDFS